MAPGLSCHLLPCPKPQGTDTKTRLRKADKHLRRAINSHSTPTYFRQACLDAAPGVNLDSLPTERTKTHKRLWALFHPKNHREIKQRVHCYVGLQGRLFGHGQPATEQTRPKLTAALNTKCQQKRQKLDKTAAPEQSDLHYFFKQCLSIQGTLFQGLLSHSYCCQWRFLQSSAKKQPTPNLLSLQGRGAQLHHPQPGEDKLVSWSSELSTAITK